jgi:hypothetical protein
VAEWQAAHDVGPMQASPEGMVINIQGDDPYVIGPGRDYPAGQALWLHIRFYSVQAGLAQVFYFDRAPSEEQSVFIPATANAWQDATVPLPPLGPQYHLRFDPPGTGGHAVLRSMSFSSRVMPTVPQWPRPELPDLPADAAHVQSGDLALSLGAKPGAFVLRVAGEKMAVGWTRPFVGYQTASANRWIDLAETATTTVQKVRDGLAATTRFADPDGAHWVLICEFHKGARPGSLDVRSSVQVDHDRSVVFLPMLMVLPGVGSFGEHKSHGLFAGLEYLDDEPSSSQADLTVPAYRREVPDPTKITFPLMVVQADHRYVGLIWHATPDLAALYDSPDRQFHSGGHVMGILFPGAGMLKREESSLVPYAGQIVHAGKPVVLSATIIGGMADSVIPAVKTYVALRGLPAMPSSGLDFAGYQSLADAGWLDSAIRKNDLFRHALPGSFEYHPVADAPMLMDWLATQTTDPTVRDRLQSIARAAVARVQPSDLNTATISHNTYPVQSLVFGAALQDAAQAEQAARSLLGRFQPDGSVFYEPAPGKPDYGKTHFARDANGLTSQVVGSLLKQASVCGDPGLIKQGLRMLRAMDKFTDSAPRGAQTWEVPLHTPDILASANLVRAYTLGYQLTRNRRYLAQAISWAWTGVPFVYLVNPTTHPVGPYATIAVLGATNWVGPVWLGRPVQWCGLVYADALYRLAPLDPTGPWQHLADGITVSGIQQTWPRGSDPDRQGLLPDSFNLDSQSRNDPGINPVLHDCGAGESGLGQGAAGWQRSPRRRHDVRGRRRPSGNHTEGTASD